MKIEISHRGEQMLKELVKHGVYGSSPEEIAGRFVEEKLREFCAKPVFMPARKAGDGEVLTVKWRA